MTRSIIALLFFLALFGACRKNIDLTTEEVLGPIPVVNVQASLTGRVTTANGLPISGATVQVAGLTLTTDDDGLFFVPKKLMNKNGTYIKASTAGFFDTGKFAFPRLNGSSFIEIKMLPKSLAPVFDSGTGGSFNTFDGATIITIPAHGIAGENGQPFTGQVYATAIWLNPADSITFDLMPGDLRAEDSEGYARMLRTFGMIGVELESASGEKLNLLPGIKASVSMPVPSAVIASAPAHIPLWHFDEISGYWQEEGSALLTGDRYTFEVGHFSFWNCDIPEDVIRLSGTVVTPNGDPLISGRVAVSSQNFGTAATYTDNEGKFSGYVPKGVPLTIYVDNSCGGFQYQENIGPFESDVELNEIQIDNPNAITVTGTLQGCDLNPVANGIAIIRLNGSPHAVVLSDNNGYFSATIATCLTNVIVSLSAFDETALLQSAQVSLPANGNPVDMGTIPVCISLDEYITVNVDGITKTFVHELAFIDPDPTDEVGRFQGTISSDTVFVLVDFINYQDTEAILASLIINLKAPGSGNTYISYHSFDVPVIYFNEYPTMPGEYAVGSVEGFVTKSPDSTTPIPYSLSFRIKKQ